MVWVPLSTNNQGGEADPCALVKGHLALLGALHFSLQEAAPLSGLVHSNFCSMTIYESHVLPRS